MVANGAQKLVIFYYIVTYSPTMPSQQVENFDRRRHARHARWPTAAHRFRTTAPSIFYPPRPK